ncbi:hypothetical protein QV06_09840 [Gallibacterium genomosp. 3]|uniref:Trimeric autotransporter adhesin YadA-like stalk domain-containing protein n=1 Tax=Gallibacterium genomosp. 3 TaxID=505345 RepID=A0A1A7PP11_9PAST|nr:collagen-like protein [Gallibacterium genomosp. 3]OBX03447.1 hypothetical protein QV06_09840 [Gallibacterium genomosp. 3]
MSETLTLTGEGTAHNTFGASAQGNIDVVANNTTSPTGLVIKLAQNLADISSIGTGKSDEANSARITFTAGKPAKLNTANEGEPSNEEPAVDPIISMNNAKVAGVLNGAVSSTSKDAINGSQLYDYVGNIRNILGSTFTQGADGKLSADNIGGTGKNTIEEAIASLQESATTAASGFNIAGNSTAQKEGKDTTGSVAPNDTLTINGKVDSGITTVADKSTDTITIDVSDTKKFGTHVGVATISANPTAKLVQEKAVKSYVDALADKIGADPVNGIDGKNGKDGAVADSGTKGIPGKDGAVGPAGKDGLNGTTVANKVQALRDGAAGTVVYTDTSGNRLLVENGKYYQTSIVEGYEKANDGLWYKAEAVNNDGTVNESALETLAEVDRNGKTLATLSEGQADSVIDPADVMLSAVEANGKTQTPTTLANVRSALGLTGKADNTKATGNTDEEIRINTENALKTPEAISLEAAQKVVAGKKKGGTGADKDTIIVDQEGKSGIYALSGAILNKVTTLGDLQAVAQAGLDFGANPTSKTDTTTVHRPLGTQLNIVGKLNKTETAGAVVTSADNYSSDNLATFVDKTNNLIRIGMLKNPSFTGVTLDNGETDTTTAAKIILTPNKPATGDTNAGKTVLNLSNGAEITNDMIADDVVITGVAAGKSKDSAVNLGQLEQLEGKIGLTPTNGVDGKDGKNGLTIDNGRGVPGSNSDDGKVGPAGKDGLNGTTIANKVQGLRDGIAGTVVYTDKAGNRLLAENGEYYDTKLVKGLEKANDGLWYAESDVDTNGNAIGGTGKTLKELATENTALAEGTEKKLKNGGKVLANEVILSAVNANGTVSETTTLANIKGNLDDVGKVITATTDEAALAKVIAQYKDKNPDALSADTKDALINAIKATLTEGDDAAKTAKATETVDNLIADAKVKADKDKELARIEAVRKAVAGDNLDGKGGLLAQTTGLSHAASVGDLQAVALAGLTFVGNDNVNIHRPLGTTFKIIGATGLTYTTEDKPTDNTVENTKAYASDYSASNLITHQDSDDTLRIEMKKLPHFEGIVINGTDGDDGANRQGKDGFIGVNDQGEVVIINGIDGKNGKNGDKGLDGKDGSKIITEKDLSGENATVKLAYATDGTGYQVEDPDSTTDPKAKKTVQKGEVKLGDGLHFNNGTNITAEIGANGVVKYNLNDVLNNIKSIGGGTSTDTKEARITFINGKAQDDPDTKDVDETTPAISVNNARVTNVATGTQANDAVNKGQLDALAAQIGITTNGKDGINGIDGYDGKAGKAGDIGQRGVPGQNGLNGADGLPLVGPAGKDGLNGTTIVNKV